MTEIAKIKDMNIAVIDDEADLLDMYEWELVDFGFKPDTFENPVKAKEAIVGGDFDLIISDVRMPVLNGLELMKSVGQSLSNPPPFIFVTGFSQYNRDELIKEGAKEVFMKPIDVENIVKWIDQYFNNRQAG